MMMMRFISTLCFVCLMGICSAQVDTLRYDIKDDKIEAQVYRLLSEQAMNEVLQEFNLNLDALDSLMLLNKGERYSSSSWELVKWNSRYLYFEKSSKQVKGSLGLLDYVWTFVTGEKEQFNSGQFNYNRFLLPDVLQRGDVSTFILRGFPNAENVYLSGSFNEWKVVDLQMKKQGDVWKLDVPLEPGRYEYKFIVDGVWKNHETNLNTVPDGQWGENNVYYVPNHRFEVSGYPSARKIIVAGSFNNWDEEQVELQRKEGAWYLDVYLLPGTYEYKFIADGRWFLDPNNPETRMDAEGNTNSVLNIGEASTFILQGFQNAKNVMLVGDFNAWNANAANMTKTDTGWTYDIVLAPGNYAYKYIVDGHYMLDPNNPLTLGTGDYTNNLFVVDPNYRFKLEGYSKAKDVRISGDFCAWDENGYLMQKQENAWFIDLHLVKGKWRYKFIVDGKWILDPSNPLYEENEYGTGNSILWVE